MGTNWWKSPALRRIRHRISDRQVYLFPALGALYRIWFYLVHRQVDFERRGPLFEYIRDKKPCIIALWHQSVFPIMFDLLRYTDTYPYIFLVKDSRIGTIGAYLLNIWNVDCVCVSRAQRGPQAVNKLSDRATETGAAILSMADGSHGPARKARWGVIYLAKNTGYPIFGVHAWGDNLVTLKRTWMKLLLPLPWGRIVLLSAEPLFIPKDADKPCLEKCRQELEQRLNVLVDEAEAGI